MKLYLPASILFFSVVACANPKYVPSLSPISDNADQKATPCQAKFAGGECVTLTWEKLPTDSDFGSFLFKTFRINRGDGSAIPEDLNGTYAVVLWMPAMGHGSSPVTLERLDVGTYRVTQVFFTMKGLWQILFQLKSGNAVKDQAILPINL